MDKYDFLLALEARLEGLPETDQQASLDYYAEILDDLTEEGLTEEEAVASLGSVDAIAEQILLDMPLSKLVKARVRPKRRLRAWTIVLIAVGSPIWFPLLLSLAVVVLAVYIVLWSVVVSLYAADLGLAAGALAGVAGCAVLFAAGNPAVALLLVGAGLVCAGLSIFGFVGCKAAAKGVWRLGKTIMRGIKACLIKKEGAS